MKLGWWIVLALACTALAPQRRSFPTRLGPWDERLFFRQVMGNQPRHWGHFAAYVVWLVLQYEAADAYRHYEEMKQTIPDLIPSLPVFVYHCLWYIVLNCGGCLPNGLESLSLS